MGPGGGISANSWVNPTRIFKQQPLIQMSIRPVFFVLSLPCIICSADPPAITWEAGHKLMGRYCMDCHDADLSKGDLNLEKLTKATVLHDYKLWENVLRMLQEQKMPPKKKLKQPSDLERDMLIAWVTQTLEQAAKDHAGDPGTVTMRRLNNAEFDSTIRDLTGIDFGLANQFPGDAGGGEGFSNTGDVLFMSPEHLDKYLAATRKLVNHAKIMPGSGFRFYENEVGLRGPDIIKSQVEQPLRVWYQKAAAPLIPDQLNELREAEYCLACWQFKHREVLSETTLEELAKEKKLDPDFLENWWWFLNHEEPPSRYLDLTRHVWRDLPPPDRNNPKQIPDAVLKGVKSIQTQRQAWYQDSVQRRQQDVNGEQPYPATVQLKGQKLVHLVVTDSGDGNKGDTMVWSNIKFQTKGKWQDAIDWLHQRKKEIEEKSVKEKAESETKSRDEQETEAAPAIDHELSTVDHLLSLYGKHVTDGKIDARSIGVQAPSVITFPVPEGATQFQASGRMDLNSPDSDWGTMQFVALAGERPETVPPFIPGHLTIWKRAGPGKDEFWKHFAPLRSTFQDTHDRRLLEVQGNFNRRWPARAVYYLSKEQLMRRLPKERTDVLESLQADWDYMGMIEEGDLNWYRNKVGLVADWGKEAKEYESLAEDEKKRLQELEAKVKTRQEEWDSRIVTLLQEFARRAWRRPLTAEENEILGKRYHAFRTEGHDSEPAGRFVLQRILVSPHFLYRVEVAGQPDGEHPVSPVELASRLSYFLWSSMPDDELLNAATSGALLNEDELLKQTGRMLADRRVSGLVMEFVGQWLEFKGFQNHTGIDAEKFPEFIPELRRDMLKETELFVSELIRQDLSVLDLLHANYSYLNERLGWHYSIPDLHGEKFVKTQVAQHHRGGLLGMGSILTRTSFPLRTSPVVRGHWLLKSVLGTPTPPPPSDVPPLPEEEAIAKKQTVRERLEEHRNKEQCAACHDRLDPLGFSLENFDPLGRWREKDSYGHPIDNSAVIKEGPTFNGIEGLRGYLKTQDDQFLKQFCTKLVGYALGRSVLVSDRELIEAMMSSLRKNEFKFSAAVRELVRSRQFRNRKNS